MTFKIRIIGALIATFPMSALAVSAASAHVLHTAEGINLTPTASSLSANHLFKIEGSEDEVTCPGVSATGTLEDNKEEGTITPTYVNCVSRRKGNVTQGYVEIEKCTYAFGGATNGNGHAQVQIGCPTGGIKIKRTTLKLLCYTIPPQTVTGVRYFNTGPTPNRDFDVKTTVKTSAPKKLEPAVAPKSAPNITEK